MMFGQLGELRKYLEKTLQGELDEFFDQKIPELIELKQSLTKVLIVDETEAEGMKFSKEVYKQCTTDYVEQCRDVFMEAKGAYHLPDEENRSEKITPEEFHGRFGEFTGKDFEKNVGHATG